jgi:hypothetical protein
VADDIEVHFDLQRGVLSLDCGAEAFARLREALLATAELGELTTDVEPSQIRTIEITEASAVQPPGRTRSLMLSLGCVVVAVGLTFVLAVGARTIAGWAR